MSEMSRISDQLHRAFYGEAWHGSSVMELLKGVTATQAAAHPMPPAHSIWEVVNHITAWKGAVVRRLQGEEVELKGDKDWPPVKDPSAASWRKTLAALEESHQRLEKAVAGLTDASLDSPVPNRDHNVYFMLHGVIQHDLYHAGQIALLKKA